MRRGKKEGRETEREKGRLDWWERKEVWKDREEVTGGIQIDKGRQTKTQTHTDDDI